MAKKLIIVGNWKGFVTKPREAGELARGLRERLAHLRGVEVALAPSFVHTPIVVSALEKSGIAVGAQTVSSYEGGAHTGEVSADALRKSGLSFVIIGHSERRAAGETDEAIRGQMERAAAAGLRAVVCVGEKERGGDHGTHFEHIEAQLKSALADIPKTSRPKLIVAYEPVWAIGRSAAEAMEPSQVREVAILIRKTLAEHFGREIGLAIPVLYGGSVDASNARQLLEGGIQGLLVGRASAEVDSFAELVLASIYGKRTIEVEQQPKKKPKIITLKLSRGKAHAQKTPVKTAPKPKRKK